MFTQKSKSVENNFLVLYFRFPRPLILTSFPRRTCGAYLPVLELVTRPNRVTLWKLKYKNSSNRYINFLICVFRLFIWSYIWVFSFNLMGINYLISIPSRIIFRYNGNIFPCSHCSFVYKIVLIATANRKESFFRSVSTVALALVFH